MAEKLVKNPVRQGALVEAWGANVVLAMPWASGFREPCHAVKFDSIYHSQCIGYWPIYDPAPQHLTTFEPGRLPRTGDQGLSWPQTEPCNNRIYEWIAEEHIPKKLVRPPVSDLQESVAPSESERALDASPQSASPWYRRGVP